MKFQAAAKSVPIARRQVGPDWDWVEREIEHTKWLVWHGKSRKALPRIRGERSKPCELGRHLHGLVK